MASSAVYTSELERVEAEVKAMRGYVGALERERNELVELRDRLIADRDRMRDERDAALEAHAREVGELRAAYGLPPTQLNPQMR